MKGETFVERHRKKLNTHTRMCAPPPSVRWIVYEPYHCFLLRMASQIYHKFPAWPGFAECVYIQRKSILWHLFYLPKVLFSKIRIEDIMWHFYVANPFWPGGHNFLPSICSVIPLCSRKAMFEMYHLEGALHHPAAKLFPHKLDT